MRHTCLVEVEWDFEEGDVDWVWCMNCATFAHREACEFILHIGLKEEDDGSTPYWMFLSEEMRKGGCTENFISAYLTAKDKGAERVLFYA